MDKTLGPFKNAVNQKGNKSTPPFPPRFYRTAMHSKIFLVGFATMPFYFCSDFHYYYM